MILATLLALAPQATTTRVLTGLDASSEHRAATLGNHHAQITGASTVASFHLPDVASIPEVAMTSVHVLGEVAARRSLLLEACTGWAIRIRWSGYGELNCRAGSSVFASVPFSYGSPSGGELFYSGEYLDVNLAEALPFDVTFNESSDPGTWSALQADPTITLDADLRGDWWAFWAPPTSVYGEACVLRNHDTVDALIRGEAFFELDETATTPYCTSQPNATGQVAQLTAYGAPDAGSEWLSIRAEQMPPGTFSLLFMADDFGLVPGAGATLCVGGTIRRVGGVQFAPAGEAQFDIDLIGWPSGSSAYFQAYFRDPITDVAASEARVLTVR